MEFCQVRLEAHQHGATIYVVGLLTDLAASRTESLIAHVPVGTAVVRMDLRGVQLIDPSAFVRIARSLSHWRDLRRGRVNIEFPQRSARHAPVRKFQSREYIRPDRATSLNAQFHQREERRGRHSSD